MNRDKRLENPWQDGVETYVVFETVKYISNIIKIDSIQIWTFIEEWEHVIIWKLIGWIVLLLIDG